MTQEEKTMLTYARDVFQGTQQVEDISYQYRQEIASFLNTLGLEQEPPQSLDEAAEESSKEVYPYEDDSHVYDRMLVNEAREYHEDGFKAGAKWMAEQGVILNLSIDELSCGAYNSCVEQGLTSEDNVIIQIRKKQ